MYRAFRATFFLLFIFLFFHGVFSHKFENIGDVGDPNFLKLLKWKFTREKPVWPSLPVNRINNAPSIPAKGQDDEIIVTYVNHSTTLIQMGEENILTDPIWSEYAGPFGKFGVKRTIYPGIYIEKLPPINIILISHSHYDHLDLPTIEKLVSKHQPIIFTGKGVTKYIDYCKKKNRCYELEWWENVKLVESDLLIHFVPAYHWSSRYFLDKDTTLWGGFVIENKNDKVYFAGDTGFSDGEIFKFIREKYGSFRLALLPIGAYKPNWFFSSMHISPTEAVKIFNILDTSYAIPLHYDTFQLSDEKYEEPLNELKAEVSKENIQDYRFKPLTPGETMFIPKD